MDYKPILQNEIYPRLSNIVDTAFPEFEFKEMDRQWVSTNTLHLSGMDGEHGKGKVTIAKNKPYVIGDFREGTKEVISYLIESLFHPQVTDFKIAVEYLASITGVSLSDNQKTDWRVKKYRPKIKAKEAPIFIPNEVFIGSLGSYENNSFAQYLIKLFGNDKAMELIERFHIGTSKYWNGATVFWLLDEKKRVGGGQVILFDENGKTVKNPFRHNTWIHRAIIKSYQNRNQSLPKWLSKYDQREGNKFPFPFGLPQLENESTKPIAIVEAAKTAIIATAYFPQYLWLAVGSLTYLNKERLSYLKDRQITLFPDNGAFHQWSKDANRLEGYADFIVSDLLERKGEAGKDIADYLIQFDWRSFQNESSEEKDEAPQEPTTINEVSLFEGWDIVQITDYPEIEEKVEPIIDWSQDIEVLEKHFNKLESLPESIELTQGVVIKDTTIFIKSQLSIIKANNGKATFLPYLERLQNLKELTL